MGPWRDFISEFLEYTDGAFSPDIFRKWSGIAIVAGALERRVWMKLGRNTTFGNLYMMLVADPGVGKQVIDICRDLWTNTFEPGTKIPAFKVAPDSMTKASLMDTLAKAKGMSPLTSGELITYHSLLIAAEEAGVLLPSYDVEYIGALNSIYNNKPLHEESRRTGSVKELKIENPQLNMLIGTQPGWLASTFPEEAWSTGLTARLMMIYSAEAPIKDLFADDGGTHEQRERLLVKLSHISNLWGQCEFSPEAALEIRQWHLDGGPPSPTHSRLIHYNRRRTSLHCPKLAMVSAISRTGKLRIEKEDVLRGRGWLLEAENFMPDIFRAMVGKSDKQVLEELHSGLLKEFGRTGRNPIPETFLFRFLRERVPTNNIQRMIEVGEKSGLYDRVANSTTYVPKPMYNFETETG